MKNRYYLVLVFLFITCALTAQGVRYGSKVILQGTVLDAKTQQPISFANIGFVGKGIGTVSDGDGNYILEFEPAALKPTDRLQFSVIGYKTRLFSKKETLLASSKPFKISLTPEPYSLDELVLDETKRRNSTIGDLYYDDFTVGYWKDMEGLGGEILTKLKVRRKNTRLENLKFKVLENRSDSLLVRVNVYDVDQGHVGRNILKASIEYTIKTTEGLVTIPLSKYNINVDQNIIVGIELLKVYGKQIGFSLAGSRSRGISFVRDRSQSYYRPVENTSMAFELDISTPDKNRNSIDKRDKANHITVYWDASASTAYRDVDKELQIVESILDKTKKAQVDVIKFSMRALEKKTFTLRGGKTEAISTYLENTQYNSLGQIEALPRPEPRENASILLVTAGQTILSDIKPDFPAPVFVITTNDQANVEELEKLALYSDGDILDGSKETVKELRKRYTHFIDDVLAETSPVSIAYGKIRFNKGDSLIPLQGVTVTARGTYRSTTTDSNGNFRLKASPGEILLLRFPGMKEKEIRVVPNGKSDALLEPIFEMLDQVMVTGKKEVKTSVETPTGKRNENAVGFKNNVIDGEEIDARYTTLGQILRRQSNIQVLYDPFSRKEIYIFPRTYYTSILTPQPPIVVIDGLIYRQDANTVLPQIDVQSIKSIATSSSLMATTQYGSIGAGGVITIKTKSTNATARKKTETPSVLVQGNEYDDVELLTLQDIASTAIEKSLRQATDLSDSRAIYFDLLKRRTNAGLDFYMTTFQIFKDKDPQFALEIITSMIAKAPENIPVLRTVGYALQELEKHTLALALYSEILELAPEDIQSYRDLAQAYVNYKEYNNAFELYKTILANTTKNLDFKPLQETAENELRRLVAFHKSKVQFSDLPNELLTANFKKDQRLVFEWSDPAAQFELQFVSPENKYFIWDHTIYKSQEKVKAAINNGIMMQEFELDVTSVGKWLINLSYLPESNDTKTAPYLRYTLYSNYATPQEKKQSNIIRLADLKEKVTIDQITLKSTDYEN